MSIQKKDFYQTQTDFSNPILFYRASNTYQRRLSLFNQVDH